MTRTLYYIALEHRRHLLSITGIRSGFDSITCTWYFSFCPRSTQI